MTPSRVAGAVVLATAVLVVLRLAGVIGWSWWWVLSPVLVGVAVVFLGVPALFLTAMWGDRR